MREKLVSLLLVLALGCAAPAALAAEPETPGESAVPAQGEAADKGDAADGSEIRGKDAAAPEDGGPSPGEAPPAGDGPERTEGETASIPDFTTISDTWGGIGWSLTPEGTLTVFPNPADGNPGVMPDSERGVTPPWRQYLEGEGKAVLTELVIKEGVTHIGSYAFAYACEYLSEITFPDSLLSIGRFAFSKGE